MLDRLEKIIEIRQKLENGAPSIGSWMQIPDSSIAEIIGNSGYDWVAIDMEHGAIDNHQLPDLFRALELGNTLPIVRISEGSPENCKHALDAGAGGIIIPMIESAEQLIKIRNASYWPPAGSRGVGFSRGNLFGERFDAYSSEAQKPILVAMIEHVKAIDNLQDILRVDGLDSIFIGPYDLSASMGITGQFENSDFLDIINKIKKMCNQEGVSCGIHIVDPNKNELFNKIAEGYQWIAYSIDSVFLRKSMAFPKN